MIRYTVRNRKPRGREYHGPGHAKSAYGLSLYHKSNSLRGVRHAVAGGFLWVDQDVMTTLDGMEVVNHSFGAMSKEHFRAKGVPNRPIDKLTWAQVHKLRSPSGTRIQRLDAMMAWYGRYNIGLALEIKGDGREGFRIVDERHVDRIVSMANAHGVRMYVKADPRKPALRRGLAMFRARGVWTRYTGSPFFMRPA